MKSMKSASKSLLVTLLALFGLVVLAGQSSAATQYTITDLGTFGGATSEAYGVNALGQVVGRAKSTDGKQHAFLWENGVMQDLIGANSAACGINDLGQIVGSMGTHAFLWEDGVMQDLGTLGGSRSSAYGINDSGQVVGMASPYFDPHSGDYTLNDVHAFLWQNGVMQDILRTSAYYSSYATGINASGQVVGWRTIPGGTQAFLRSASGSIRILESLDDPPSGGPSDSATARGINDAGQVVGWSYGHAVMWEGDVLHDLGTLGGISSDAYAINESCQIVGCYTASGIDHAFLWQDGTMLDLNTLLSDGSGWDLTEARGINDLGQIVGYGKYGGQDRAFLLNPIPEPSTLALLALGLPAIAMRRLRKR